MNGLVTATADDKGFTLPGCHDAYPGWLLGPSFPLEVSEFADVVDFTILHCSAEFARAREEPCDQLVAPEDEVRRVVIYENGLSRSPQGNAPEPGHERLVAFPFHHDRQAAHGAIGRGESGPVLLEHLFHTRLVFRGERFEQRGLHHPMQPPEPGDVLGEQIILHEAPILRLVLIHDGVIGVEQQFRSGGSLCHRAGTELASSRRPRSACVTRCDH